MLSELKKRQAQVELGGGAAKLQKQRDQGKLTARERIAYLVDAKQPSLEIASFAGDSMYEEYGGCPAGGVVLYWPTSKGVNALWWRMMPQ